MYACMMDRQETPVYLRTLVCLSLDTETWGEAGKFFPPSCRVRAPSTLARQDLPFLPNPFLPFLELS